MSAKSRLASRRQFLGHVSAAGLAASLLSGATRAADAPAAAVKVAVLTGGHAYDVPNFEKLFQSLSGIHATIQTMEAFFALSAAERDAYDALLFYHMLMPVPTGAAKEALEHLGSTEQGLLVLHHALLAYPKWPVWSEIVGIADRKFGYHHDQQLHIHVTGVRHPITQGLKDWDMIDETYTMADAGQGSEILLTTDHPQSMKTIGWTRQYRQSRVFCLESGHDNQTWVSPDFREVLRRGLLWCARKI